MLLGLFKNSLKCSELPYLVGNRTKTLVSDFYSFYTSGIMMFKNSMHIFDEEKEIQEYFEKDELLSRARSGRYCFIPSGSDAHI